MGRKSYQSAPCCPGLHSLMIAGLDFVIVGWQARNPSQHPSAKLCYAAAKGVGACDGLPTSLHTAAKSVTALEHFEHVRE